MSAENKTRYEVQKILSDCIKSGLSAYVGSEHGFGVMEFAQASFQKADRVVLMNKIRTDRIGWQTGEYKVDANILNLKDEWVECQHWQLSVLLKKSESPTVQTMEADDYAGVLITWFNGKGCDYLRSKGVAPERINPSTLMIYNDDSELYQKRAVFTVRLQVPKELTSRQAEVEAIVPKVKPV